MLSQEARRNGKPVFNLANEIIEWYLWAKNHGFEPSEALMCYESIRAARSVGTALIPLEFYDLVLRINPLRDDKRAVESWRLSGYKLGKFLSSMSKDLFYSLRVVDTIMLNFVEIKATQDRGEIVVTVLGPKIDLDIKEFLDAYFMGLFSGLNYEVVKKDVIKGLHIYRLRKH